MENDFDEVRVPDTVRELLHDRLTVADGDTVLVDVNVGVVDLLPLLEPLPVDDADTVALAVVVVVFESEEVTDDE